MKKRITAVLKPFLTAILVVGGLFVLLVTFAVISHASTTADETVYFPLVKNDPTRTPMPTNTPIPSITPVAQSVPPPYYGSNYITNGSFEDGWTDFPPIPELNWLINQKPNSWEFSWVEIGQPLFGVTDIANGVPECIHKLNDQLPPDEQLGGPNALILDGGHVYKMFHGGASFGTELKQKVYGLTPGQDYRLTVPVQLHYQGWGDPDPWGAESGVWINGDGGWLNRDSLGDRRWNYLSLEFTAPGNGQAEVIIRFKSKYNLGQDFFIDDVHLHAID